MAFNDIAGNDRVKKILKLALAKDRIPNSLLFGGPEGIGKKRIALTLAKVLNCLRLKNDSCDRCDSCLAIDKDFGLTENGSEGGRGRFPDVMEIGPERNTIRIAQIRLLKQIAYMKPMKGRRRIFIIDEAEKMNEESENSLLKVLEEPPSFAHIILVTSNPFLLLPTIRSRCQTLSFAAVTHEEIRRQLVAAGCPEAQARILSLLVDGNLEKALDLDWESVRSLKQEAWSFFSGLFREGRLSPLLERFGKIPRAVIEEVHDVMEIFLSFARDLVLLQSEGDAGLLLNPDYEAELREVAAGTTVKKSLAVLSELELVLSALPGNLNKSLLMTTFVSNVGELTYV
jgi:DNA polymerase III delta' subunit